ncbi:ECF transporter S component [Planosporangium sp. 12N6]|uniref:ECF transporter S component n=1 Tax=Planosporangium spinosum TaxID=3402278 RepID=UPI003CF804F2
MNNRWRTVDVVVASVIAVAFGVVFWAWALLYNGPAEAFPLPGRALLYGVWLVPAVLGALVIRKPGAATYTELVAAIVSALLGNSWGWTVIPQGLLEGLGAELVFLALLYRSFGLLTALVAGAAAGVAATAFDVIVWYPGYSWATFRLPYIALAAVGSAVVAGAGGWALTRALAQTGALDRFPSGRERAAI